MKSSNLDKAVGQRWTVEKKTVRNAVRFRIRVDRRRIGYVNAIIEGYDNLARVQTEDVNRGVLVLDVPESSVDVLRGVLDDINRKFEIEWLDEN